LHWTNRQKTNWEWAKEGRFKMKGSIFGTKTGEKGKIKQRKHMGTGKKF